MGGACVLTRVRWAGRVQVLAAGATADGARGRSAIGRSSRRVRPWEAPAERRPSAGPRSGCERGRRPEGRPSAGPRGGCERGRRPEGRPSAGHRGGCDRGRRPLRSLRSLKGEPGRASRERPSCEGRYWRSVARVPRTTVCHRRTGWECAGAQRDQIIPRIGHEPSRGTRDAPSDDPAKAGSPREARPGSPFSERSERRGRPRRVVLRLLTICDALALTGPVNGITGAGERDHRGR